MADEDDDDDHAQPNKKLKVQYLSELFEIDLGCGSLLTGTLAAGCFSTSTDCQANSIGQHKGDQPSRDATEEKA